MSVLDRARAAGVMAGETAVQHQRLFRAAAGFSRVLIVQTLIQVLVAVSGLLVVRALGTTQYALYTVGAAAVTAVAALTNGGVLDGMTVLGARARFDAVRLATLIRVVTALRRRLALGVLLPIGVPTAWLLWHQGASLPTITLVVLSVSLVGLGELRYSVLHLVPWLQGKVEQLQAVELQGALARVAGCAVLPVLIPRADIAILCAAAAYAVQLCLLHRRGLVPAAEPAPEQEPEARTEIMRILRRQWPNDLNALAQSQASLWLLTLFAGSADIAAFGALSRVSLIFAIILQAVHRTMLARYAVQQDRRRGTRLYVTILAAFAAAAAPPLAALLAFPGPVLALFGPAYEGLSPALRLVAVNAFLASLASLTLWLNTTRAWIMPSGFRILYQSGFQIGLVLLTGARSVEGVVLAGIGVNAAIILANIVYSRLRFRQIPEIVENA